MSLVPPFPYFPWAGTVEVRGDGSVWRIRSRNRPCEPRRIDMHDGAKGYRKVVLPLGGRWLSTGAHRIVWWWNYGDPGEFQVNHKNLNKADNRIENLELATGSQNIIHSYANGRTVPWSRTVTYRGKPRIDAQRALMVQRREEGATLKQIAMEFNCSISHAHRLCAEWR